MTDWRIDAYTCIGILSMDMFSNRDLETSAEIQRIMLADMEYLEEGIERGIMPPDGFTIDHNALRERRLPFIQRVEPASASSPASPEPAPKPPQTEWSDWRKNLLDGFRFREPAKERA